MSLPGVLITSIFSGWDFISHSGLRFTYPLNSVLFVISEAKLLNLKEEIKFPAQLSLFGESIGFELTKTIRF